MTTYRARRTARTAALATVTAALALGLTACGGADGGSKASGGGHSAGTAQSRSASDEGAKGSAAQANSSGDTKEGAPAVPAVGGAQQIASKSTTAGVQPCRGDGMMVTAVHRFAGQQGDHLLLTAVNEGTKPCWVTSYPAVVLDWNTDNVALPHSTKDAPGGDKHITLQPGGKVYSAVNLFDYGSKNRTAQSLAFALRGEDGRPGPFYSVVSKGQNQKFTWTEADVLNWNAKKPYDF
ncbi:MULTISPECIES: DUF4232 domain-containing protein [unclassified Streptomyces]|uniref:DUF4232 domain-containing protein n=1 Tax=unclassified Streptomyces TaxID=2593676 RepID=UPI00341481B0